MRYALLLLLCLACKGAPQPAPEPKGSSSVAPAAPASAPAKAPMTWYEGAWQGTYRAELLRLETAAGGPKAWKEDDGSKASGEGKLSLEAAADGTVKGSASGPLGTHELVGRVEGDRIALSLVPQEPSGFRGVILANHVDGRIDGSLTASTGDGLSARKATLTLARTAP